MKSQCKVLKLITENKMDVFNCSSFSETVKQLFFAAAFAVIYTVM